MRRVTVFVFWKYGARVSVRRAATGAACSLLRKRCMSQLQMVPTVLCEPMRDSAIDKRESYGVPLRPTWVKKGHRRRA